MPILGLSLTKLDETQNHEDFNIVWLSLDKNHPDELDHVSDYLVKWHSFEDCDKHIRGIRSERKICLVLVHLLEHASYFDGFSQIQSIYALERNPKLVRDERPDHSKLIGIFPDERALIKRLRQDILLTFRNDFHISISHLREMTNEQSLTSLDGTTDPFLWNLAFTYYLVNSPSVDMDELRETMRKQCELEYKHDQIEWKKIHEFCSECTADNVLRWYTKDSFAYRLVNRAFRTRNIDLIGKFRYFTILLYKKLKELSRQQNGSNYTMVYRGQTMKRKELDDLQRSSGCLISINTLMSTTRDEQLAHYFAFAANISVVLEIDISSAQHETLYPFADISALSSIPDENEVLFFPGAVFLVHSVTESIDGLPWIVKLVFKNETVALVNQIMNCFEKITLAIDHDQIFTQADDVRLFPECYEMLTGKSLTWKDLLINKIDLKLNPTDIFKALGDPEKTIEYCKRVVSHGDASGRPEFIVLHIVIGVSYSYLCDNGNALLHYGIALSLLDDQNKLIGELYNHIGDVWASINNVQSARACYKEALRIFHHCGRECQSARVCRKLARLYQQQNNDQEAIIYEAQANEIDDRYGKSTSPDSETAIICFQKQLDSGRDLSPRQRADRLYSIGLYLQRKADYLQALEKFSQAKQLLEKHVTPDHSSVRKLAKIFDHMAVVHLFLKDNFNALAMWKRAIDIRTGSFFD